MDEKVVMQFEYVSVVPQQLRPSLETKAVENLFTAGQMNGTSGIMKKLRAKGFMAGI